MSETPADLVRAFWKLVPERVTEATELWLSIEQGDREKVPPLRRLLHTIKGEAHMLGLDDCAVVFEKAEQVVDAVTRVTSWPQPVGDALLGAFELYGLLGATEGAGNPEAVPEICRQLEVARASLAGEPVADAAPAPAPEPAAKTAAAPRAAQAVPVEDLSPLLGEVRRLHAERLLLQPPLREIHRTLLTVERGGKTDLGKVSELARKVGALVADWTANDFMTGLLLEQMDDLVRRAVVVPLSRLEGQIHRVARGVAQTLGKKVDVTVRGDALIDAAIERRLAPALLQLVRNALDHGIEAADVRVAKGKSPRGKIAITFAQAESSVRVDVADDGAGIDVDRLRERLAARGLDVDTLDRERVIASIFEHGVTTRDVATEISGRGVGLDVVASEVATVGGRVHAESPPEGGTRFVLQMPATLRVDIAVPVLAGPFRCALPSRAVTELLRIVDIDSSGEGPSIRVRFEDEMRSVPVRSLAALLGHPWNDPAPGDVAVVLDHPAGRFAVTVEAFESPRPLSAQPTRDLAFRSPFVRGVAPTPDGNVLLLLDVFALHDAMRSRVAPRPTKVSAPHVLVAEDAPVARELLCGILRSFGLRVSATPDGAEGLAVAQRDPPDLVVTDVEMPVLDGLELVARIRDDPSLGDVPIIVLTNRSDEETRDRAATLGVDGYLTKERFVEADLRRLVDGCLKK